jgi:hypothetical protein
VRNLNTTRTESVERQEARALIAKLLGGTVNVRREREAAYSRLKMESAICSSPAENRLKSTTSNVVAGGCYELYSNYPLQIQLPRVSSQTRDRIVRGFHGDSLVPPATLSLSRRSQACG